MVRRCGVPIFRVTKVHSFIEEQKVFRCKRKASLQCNMQTVKMESCHIASLSVISNLTHCSRETRKRVIGKQCRPRSDAAESTTCK